MNSKRILSAVVVLALAVGCAWGSTAASFTVIPDKEAVQIVGGSGKACNIQTQIEGWWWCDGTWMGSDPVPEGDCNGTFIYIYERWVCGDAPSGECYNIPMILMLYCPCQWFAEYQNCSPNNNWQGWWGYACQ